MNTQPSPGPESSPPCDTCGNRYDKAFTVTQGGAAHTFDSFECAIQALAPTCDHCGTRIIGHGIESGNTMFCCAHCAAREGVTAAVDNVPDTLIVR